MVAVHSEGRRPDRASHEASRHVDVHKHPRSRDVVSLRICVKPPLPQSIAVLLAVSVLNMHIVNWAESRSRQGIAGT